MEKKIISKSITLSKVILFLFLIIFIFIMLKIIFFSENNIFKFSQDINVKMLIINFIIISVLMIIPFILIIKVFFSFITKDELIIDNDKSNIVLVSKYFFLNIIKIRLSLNLLKIKEIFLVLISRNKIDLGIINTYNIFIIDDSNSYKKLYFYHNYDDAIKLVEFISENTNIKYNDCTDIKYSSEFDFLKFYKKE